MANRYVSELFKSGEEFEEYLKQLNAFKQKAEDGGYCALIPQYTIEPNSTIDTINNNYKDSFPVDCFNRRPVVGDVFYVAGRTQIDHITFFITAQVTGFSTANGREFAQFKTIEVVPFTNVKTADSATTAASATKATQDGDGNVIKDTYAKTAALTDGTITVAKATSATSATKATSATSATSATKATQDGDGNVIKDTYAKTAALTDGTIAPAKALKAINDGSGKEITTTYAKKTDLTDGTITVKNATNATSATSATKATQDGDGNVIKDTYAKTADLTSATGTKVARATSADSATKATQDGNGKTIYGRDSLWSGSYQVAHDVKDVSPNIKTSALLNRFLVFEFELTNSVCTCLKRTTPVKVTSITTSFSNEYFAIRETLDFLTLNSDYTESKGDHSFDIEIFIPQTSSGLLKMRSTDVNLVGKATLKNIYEVF